MKRTCIILSTGVLLLLPLLSKAQHKYEREYRMKAAMVPEPARAFVDAIGADSRIKWFKEIGLSDVTIEAKFNHNKRKFSVEFDTLGTLEDAEFIIKKLEIDSLVFSWIEQNLDSLYQKWKFRKIQMHYEGQSSDVIAAINDNKSGDGIQVSYEIVLKGTAHRNTRLFEILFDDQGEIQSLLQIIQDKADHLEY
jgi:hypothetical protein